MYLENKGVATLVLYFVTIFAYFTKKERTKTVDLRSSIVIPSTYEENDFSS